MREESSREPPGQHSIWYDYFHALYRVSHAINSNLHVPEVLTIMAEKITEAMQAKACSLRLLDKRTGTLTISAEYGLSEAYLHKGPVQVEHSPLDQEVLRGNSVYIANAAEDARFQYREQARREGIVSVFCVPLIVHGETIGVLRVYSGQPRTFSEAEQEFLGVLASVAALAVENARLYQALKRDYEETMDALWGVPWQDASRAESPSVLND
jgi:signal transduction protein with GAF and PtsI domain